MLCSADESSEQRNSLRVNAEPTFDEALDRAESSAKRLDEWRTLLLKLGSDSITDISETSFLGRELRAAACIAAMAELEGLLREMLVSIGEHVSSAHVPVSQLTPSLRSLAAHTVFESLSNLGDNRKVWAHRLTLTSLEGSSQIAQLPKRVHRGAQPPLDGRTIQSPHISLIWSVLGIQKSVPAASVVASLKKLTQIRNDVAHRNVDIVQVFSEAGRTANDIEHYLDDITLLIVDIGNEWSSYIAERSYLVNSPPRSLQ